jgi:hypothetical protein
MGHSHQGDEQDSQKRTAEDKEAGMIMIGDVSGGGLDDKGKKAADSRDQSDLCQCERELFYKERQQRVDESRIEIACKVNQGKGDDDSGIRFLCFGHGLTLSTILSELPTPGLEEPA